MNPNKEMINASDEEHDPNSVLAFYRELIHLRHSNPVIAAGRWSLLDGEDKRVYAFVRSLEGFDLSDTIEHQQVVVVANLTGRSAQIPPEAAAALGLDPVAFPVDSGMTIDEDNVLISNYPRSQTLSALFTGRLSLGRLSSTNPDALHISDLPARQYPMKATLLRSTPWSRTRILRRARIVAASPAIQA